ncbi:AraC family transcriptional regulator [Paraflavitalea sp. CAU 1676]|uniref:AraC family transcriptional regulator n=1 Tax=Paraflavitalea sp. CAU 1676 TaxID=3032598 RepID=UPI0023DB67A0|nr:AraC family transcriptional regulator [Paraflavitalea sp. CAU 1676]MDF2193341.1 AraC family transcriptional regulator [Paraflavitalea sp. CAU 1676]
MRPQLLKVSTGPRHSFSVRRDLVPYVNNRWHYHPEIELIHFKKGEGTQFIGDSIKRFKSGDIVMVGAHLPHYWRFDDLFFEEDTRLQADIRVAHFCENFWGEQFLHLPENIAIKSVLEKARRGLQITGKTRQQVAELLERLLKTDGSERIIILMEALNIIADCKQLSTLSSIGFKHDLVDAENDRVNAIYEYSLKNYKRKIQLEEIAAVANISPNSFCRYFKSRTRKTYSQFLIEIRVGQACKLLIENNLSIKQLCYESGFNNFTSFHKYFKMITGKSPLSYQKEFIA